MRIHRIHTFEDLLPDHRVVLDAASSHYLARVLRVIAGQPLVLFNGDGFDYSATVEKASKSGLVAEITARLPAVAESPLRTTLVQSLARGERTDFALQKATELGLTAFQPVEAARTEVRLKPDKLEARMAHWQKVMISACEQCGRASLPELRAPMDLASWAASEPTGVRLVLAPGDHPPLSQQELADAVEVLVGPEGGFEDHELELLHRSGVKAVSLGPRILRTETAGPAALAILQSMAGDF
ncbi:MAG TPA: 16S rRNA (uracil(1498)-N(3))-methyltransferase [Xanthomonadales bacterium]|nr:16S rRNA (uracil(1498)-N(3))-methyltransferase [Xanthomonadales bacterium]